MKNKWLKIGALAAGLIVAAGVALYVVVRLTAGYWPGPGAFVRAVVNAARAAADRPAVAGGGGNDRVDIVFLHHSTGNNLIEQGSLREQLAAAGHDLWDHGYNSQGLRRPDGGYAGYNYSVPYDSTDPDGLARIFAQPELGLPVNTLSALLQHDVIIIKSCFAPANHITSDEQLAMYRAWYAGIRQTMDRHPDKLFIVMTTPPLNPAETTAGEAARARALAGWLASDEFASGGRNVAVFDLFDRLAEGDPARPDASMLRQAYRDGGDSHPNRTANQIIAPQFADFVVQAIQAGRAGRHPVVDGRLTAP